MARTKAEVLRLWKRNALSYADALANLGWLGFSPDEAAHLLART